MQLAPTTVADVGRGGGETVVAHGREQARHALDEPVATRIGLRQHPAELVDDDAGAAGRLAVRGQDAQQAARADGGGSKCPLGLQYPLELGRSARARYANTALVTAMNGTGSGTVSSGIPSSSAAVIRRSGARWCGSSVPRPNPIARTPAPSSSPMYDRQPSVLSGSNRPMVSSSSPPCSHGPGWANSETAAASISRSTAARPATSCNPSDPSSSNSATVSIGHIVE